MNGKNFLSDTNKDSPFEVKSVDGFAMLFNKKKLELKNKTGAIILMKIFSCI